MYYSDNIKKVEKSLNTTHKGLSSEEVETRQNQYGKNELQSGKKKTKLGRFFAQLKDFMIIILFVAAIVSGVIAIIEKNYMDLIDSGLIFLIIFLNAIVGVIQETKADQALESLKGMSKPYAKVIRDGKVEKVKVENLTIGDIVVLEAGDIVPADLRLIETASLKVEESNLTGESLAVEKDATLVLNKDVALGDRKNMAYSSTVVTYGHGKGIVVAIGMDTEVGKIAQMLKSVDSEKTPLQKQINKTAKVITVLVLIVAAAIFVFSVANTGFTVHNVLNAFMLAVAIAVAAVPEGLPAVITIILSLGIKQMSNKKAIVKNMPAVETLGCCNVICSDKTGTLTLNKMTVKELYTLKSGQFFRNSKPHDDIFHLHNCLMLCNDTIVENEKLFGDPTETALTRYCLDMGFDVLKECKDKKRIDEVPFDSNRKLMTTVNKIDGEPVSYTKGAVDMLLNRCSKIYDGNIVREITDMDKKKILKANKDMGSKALRVLGLACKMGDLNKETIEEDLIFIGLVGMIDPPREEVKDAVRICKEAGITAVMITGDHMDTARAIATEIGILGKNDLCITGKELDEMSDKEFMKKLTKIRVYARVSPENKVRIVMAFKAKGKVVAMTGDGVNDAPSIKSADVGIGMGITGTDVSKQAADVVLTDDNFATIVTAVGEGRKIYNNIKRVIQYLLSTNIVEVLTLFIATIVLRVPFLTSVMILWINLVTDSLPAISLGLESSHKDVMKEKPRDTNGSLFEGRTGKNILSHAIMQTILVMSAFCIGEYVFNDPEGAMTMAFVTLSFMQLFHAYNCRSQTDSLFSSNPFKNTFLNLSAIFGFVLVLMITNVPVLEMFFGIRTLTWAEFAISFGFAFAVIPIVELYKLIIRSLKKSKKKTRR